MTKLFRKDEIWFAIVCIIIYVLAFGNADSLSVEIGIPKLLTVAVGVIMSTTLLAFVRKNGLGEYLGLCRVKPGSGKRCLYFLPLVIISSVNLWNGVAVSHPLSHILLHIISMCFVGFLEELIFRGLLFNGMSKGSLTAAIIVSSVTFGAGHIVNLFMGAPLLDTLLQLVYAAAVGFCFTAVFLACGSILPCIIVHAIVNSLSIFALEPGVGMNLFMCIVQTAVSLVYGLYLLKKTWTKRASG